MAMANSPTATLQLPCSSSSTNRSEFLGPRPFLRVPASALPSSDNAKTLKTSFHVRAVQAAEPASSKVAPETAASPSSSEWSVTSWKSKKAVQLPTYPDEEALNKTLEAIAEFPPLVFAGEARSLEEKIGEAALGRAFLLQGGDCAESFKEFNANNIRDTFRVLLQMGAVLMFGGQMPVVKV